MAKATDGLAFGTALPDLRATAHAADPFCVGGQGVRQGSHLAASDGRVLAEQANDG